MEENRKLGRSRIASGKYVCSHPLRWFVLVLMKAESWRKKAFSWTTDLIANIPPCAIVILKGKWNDLEDESLEIDKIYGLDFFLFLVSDLLYAIYFGMQLVGVITFFNRLHNFCNSFDFTTARNTRVRLPFPFFPFLFVFFKCGKWRHRNN